METSHWKETFPSFPLHPERVHWRKQEEMISQLKCEFTAFSFEKKITGTWIVQDCSEPGCHNQIGYWSIQGGRLGKYYNAKCEEHRDG